MRTKVIIAIAISLFAMLLLINHLWDKEEPTIDNATAQIEDVVPLTQKVSEVTTTIKQTTTKKKTSNFTIKESKEVMKNYAKEQVELVWGIEHWEAFYNIVLHESNWNPNDINKKSGACGLFQMYPCSKTSKEYKIDYKAQIKEGIQYIKQRYGNPKNAWEFWQIHKWY